MDQTEQDEAMSLYGLRFSLSGAAQFLGWSGALTSFLFILEGLDLLFSNITPPECQTGQLSLCGIPFAIILILGNVGFFDFSCRLGLKVRQNDPAGLKAHILTGCYILAGLEAAVCLAGLAPLATSLSLNEAFLAVLQWGSPLLYILIMVLGLTKSQPSLLSGYIIFKIVHFLLFVLAWLIIWTIVGALSLKYQVELLLITDLLFLIIIGFYYVLSTGFVVIHYNVLVNQARAANPAQIRI